MRTPPSPFDAPALLLPLLPPLPPVPGPPSSFVPAAFPLPESELHATAPTSQDASNKTLPATATPLPRIASSSHAEAMCATHAHVRGLTPPGRTARHVFEGVP